MAKTRKDEFAQTAYITVTESAANTLTFNGLSVFSNILEPKALVIHKVIYEVSPSYTALMTADNDSIEMGLSGDNGISSIALDDPQIYDYRAFYRRDVGTAGTGFYYPNIIEVDLGGMPGGGILVPADRVYAFCAGNGLASAIKIELRFFFTVLDLTPQQYLELAQALRVVT